MSIEPPIIETTDTSTLITLPRRRYGYGRAILLTALTAEIVFLVGLIQGLKDFDWKNPDTTSIALSAGCGFGSLAAVACVIFGLLLNTYMRGRAVLSVGEKEVTASEAGFLRNVLGEVTIKRERIIGLSVAPESADAILDDGETWAWRTRAVLRAERAKGQPEKLVAGYPRAVLELAAEALQAALGSGIAVQSCTAVAERSFKPRHKPPHNTTLIREETADGVQMTVPPRGLLEGGGPRLLFGTIWTGVVGVIALIIFNVGPKDMPWNLLTGVFGLFLGLGLFAVLSGIASARRHGKLIVSGDELQVHIYGLLGSRTETFQRDELIDIRTRSAQSGEYALITQELVLHRVGGGTRTFLSGWPDDDLQWLATVLRTQLRLPRDSSSSTE